MKAFVIRSVWSGRYYRTGSCPRWVNEMEKAKLYHRVGNARAAIQAPRFPHNSAEAETGNQYEILDLEVTVTGVAYPERRK